MWDGVPKVTAFHSLQKQSRGDFHGSPHSARMRETLAGPWRGTKHPQCRSPCLHTYRSNPYGGHKSPLLAAPSIEMPFMER